MGHTTVQQHTTPSFFQELISFGCISPADIRYTPDRFAAVTKSIAEILIKCGIETFPNDNNEECRCDYFYDDWYFYAVPQGSGWVYSLFKMREQEFDATLGGDGDSPGITVSFIAFKHTVVIECLKDPTPHHRKLLNREINRVVSDRGQTHHPALKTYFKRTEAQGPYLIAVLYTAFIASFAKNGEFTVPLKYTELYRSNKPKNRRIPLFIESNNKTAGYTVCDHRHIYIRNPKRLTVFEQYAILATHTANTSFHSFAAEVQFHACFLMSPAKIPIPFLGRSVYDSAIRADMSIDDGEFQGPTPYYRPNSCLVRRQKRCHPINDYSPEEKNSH